MPRCPRCGTKLEVTHEKAGEIFFCGTCKGSGVSAKVLLNIVQSRHVVKIVEAAELSRVIGKANCPRCGKGMVPTRHASRHGPYEIDFCLDCHLVWFDAGEFESAPKTPEMKRALEKGRQLSAGLSAAIGGGGGVHSGGHAPALETVFASLILLVAHLYYYEDD